MPPPAQSRFIPFATWLLALACVFAAPLHSVAVLTPPARLASWGLEESRSGLLSSELPANQDGIGIPAPCASETASGLPEWLSRDPIEESGGLNLYTYVRNEPLGRIDTNGLDALFLVGRNKKNPSLFNGAYRVAAQYERLHSGEKAIVVQVRNYSDIYDALSTHRNLNRVDYWGHGDNQSLFTGDTGDGITVNDPTQDVSGLPTNNVNPGATINLISCYSASGPGSIAQAFADHFGVSTSGFTTDVNFPFGLPNGRAATVEPGQTSSPGVGISTFPTWLYGAK